MWDKIPHAGCVPLARSFPGGRSAPKAQKVAAETNFPRWQPKQEQPQTPTTGPGAKVSPHPAAPDALHSPATGDWGRWPQRSPACPLLGAGHWVGSSWGQPGTERSQGRDLEGEWGDPIRTTRQRPPVGRAAHGTKERLARQREPVGSSMAEAGGPQAERLEREPITPSRPRQGRAQGTHEGV